MRMTLSSWVQLIALSILWGGAFFFAAVAVAEIPPLSVVLARTGLAAPLLAGVLIVSGQGLRMPLAFVGPFLVMGLVNNLIPFSLLFWAQTHIPSGLASILNATTPLFSIAIAHGVLADERLSLTKLTGVVFGVIGVSVMLAPDTQGGDALGLLAMFACLGAAASYGVASVFGRRFRTTGLRPIQVAFGQVSATTVMMLPIVAVFDQPWTLPMPSVNALLALAGLAVLSTAVAYILFFRILEAAGAVNVALVTVLIPVTALLLGVFLLGEHLEPWHYAGMALIGTGLLIIDGRPMTALRHRRWR